MGRAPADAAPNAPGARELLDCEAPLHAREVRIAHELVRALLQRHRDRDGAGPAHALLAGGGELLVLAGAGEVAGVEGRLVDDLEDVLARLQGRDLLAGLRERDREAGADGADERGRGGLSGQRCPESGGPRRDRNEEAASHRAPLSVCMSTFLLPYSYRFGLPAVRRAS